MTLIAGVLYSVGVWIVVGVLLLHVFAA